MEFSTKDSPHCAEKQENMIFVGTEEAHRYSNPMTCLWIVASWSDTLHLYGYKNGLSFIPSFQTVDWVTLWNVSPFTKHTEEILLVSQWRS